MRINEIFDDVRRTERMLSRELLVRFALITVCCATGWLFLRLAFLPVWMVCYMAMAVLEKHLVMRSARMPPRRALWVTCIAGFTLASVFAVLPIMVWNIGSETAKFATGLLLCGAALNIFLLRARNLALGVAYMLPICAAFYWIAFSFFTAPTGGTDFWIGLVLCLSLTIYFWVCLVEADRAQTELTTTRAQFEQAQKIEGIGQMTSGISHDFNNILNVVQGNLELLRDYPDTPDRADFVNEALTATRRGAELVQALTSYGRAAASHETLLDPADVLRAVADMAARVLPANIHLDVQYPAPGQTIMVNETTLQSALLNLVINARDAMPSGGNLTLRVNTSAPAPDTVKASAAGHIAFEVRDTGTGIPPDLIDRVRDPFMSTKPKGEGSGLGLPMVSGFAVKAGGDITIDSTPGAGTTLRLFLPLT
ncbi:MAG: ATP-binding protein [Pseudomonadota bacterium]